MPNNPNDRNQSGSQKSGSQQNSNQRPQSSSEKTPQSSSSGGDINLRLTPEQQAQIRQATGKNLQSLSLSVEDLGQGVSQGSSSSRSEESGYSSSRSEEDATGSENERMDEEV